MKKFVRCSSCGASAEIDKFNTESRCAYCKALLHYQAPWDLGLFSRKAGVGKNTASWVNSGILLCTALSFFCVYLDSPGWFRSDLAIGIWSAGIPLLTLYWTYDTHPSRRSLKAFALFTLANALPWMIGIGIKVSNKLFSDDCWGIALMYGSASAVCYLLGAFVNNFRK